MRSLGNSSVHDPSSALEFEHVHCNLCGANDADTVYESSRTRVRTDLVHVFRASGDEPLVDPLVRCRRCGLEYVNPRLRGEVIVNAYSYGADPQYVSQMSARERTFARSLQHIERLANGKGTLLDVGTAAGAFLASAQRRGWVVEGCEPNRWLAQWGSRHYGLRIRVGGLFDQEFSRRSFDVVTMWDVIEHTPNPSAVIARAVQLLKRGGLLVVNFPDRGSWLARLLGRRWPFLSSVHLYYFTRGTMTRLLEKHDLSVIHVKPHIQYLDLDYLLMRAAAGSARWSRVLRRLTRAAGLSRLQVPYWLGQTFMVARMKARALAPAMAGPFLEWSVLI